MNKKNMTKKIFYIVLFAFIMIIIVGKKVDAANATISCDSTGTVNAPMKISVVGTAAQWNLKIVVDRNSNSI